MERVVERNRQRERHRGLAAYRAAVGVALIAVWWVIAWAGVRPFSGYYFFPIWFGYILTVDALLAFRTGTSPISRSGVRVVWLFLLSVPLWWVFEAFNQVVGNWQYHQARHFPTIAYVVLSSLAFSTVVPAVLTTSELVRSFRLRPLAFLPAVSLSRRRLLGLHLAGWVMILVTWLWPTWAFPLVWLSGIFLIDPIVTVLGGCSVGSYLEQGDWSIVSNLGLGTLICGFFWEMWNVYSLPKWTYAIPHVGWLHIFEMPILGYGGYLPFGLEVYVAYALARRILRGTRINVPDVPVSSVESIDRSSSAHL
jgi:hypothetical protein